MCLWLIVILLIMPIACVAVVFEQGVAEFSVPIGQGVELAKNFINNYWTWATSTSISPYPNLNGILISLGLLIGAVLVPVLVIDSIGFVTGMIARTAARIFGKGAEESLIKGLDVSDDRFVVETTKVGLNFWVFVIFVGAPIAVVLYFLAARFALPFFSEVFSWLFQ